jgi:hypothetical protein
MNGKIAWICSARAFDASQNERLPRLLRRVCFRFGIAWFWTALALEGRAMEVWRDQRAERGAERAWGLAAAAHRWRDRLSDLVWKQAAPCSPVPAWSLPDSRRIRGLGLGCMWAVLCPFCREFHTHSPGEGPRTPHCAGPAGDRYVLEYAGPLPVEHHLRFCLSAKAGWPRLLQHWPQPSFGIMDAAPGMAAMEPLELEAAA